jgi:hypothetical protein
MSGRYHDDAASFMEMATDAGTRELIPDLGPTDDRPYAETVEPVLCRDCVYSVVGTFVDCRHPSNLKPDLVVGGMQPRNSARWLREEGPCGIVGLFFKEKA